MALAVGFAFLAALGLSSGTILIRLGTQRVSPPTATFLAVVVGTVVAVSLALALNPSEMWGLPPQAFGWFAVLAALGYMLARLLNYSAISMIGAARVAPMGSMAPLFAVILAVAILGERPNLLVGLGTPVIVSGLALALTGGTPASHRGRPDPGGRLGYLLAFASSSTFGGRDVVSRHVVTNVASPLVTSAFALALGSAMLLILTHRDLMRSFRHVPISHLGICALAGLSQGLASICIFQALSRAPVTVVSPIYASTPLFTLAMAHFLLQRLESVTLLLVVGTLLSVGGVVMVILGAAD